MGRIPEEILERIQDSCNIVEVISGYIPLKKSGANFKAPCPFHHEKTPSFMVSPVKQIYHCFGCGAGGNVVNFLMQHERLSFREAVEQLAKKSGILLPQTDYHRDTERVNLNDNLYGLNELACKFYQENLRKEGLDSNARDYLDKRGINEEQILKFKIGIASDVWDGFLNFAKVKGFNLGALEKSGLVILKDNKSYDRFRKRLIFPIFDIKDRPIAFGARCFDDSLPKYINSPETPVYVKGQHLYGLNFSKDFIRAKDFCIIVEGYLDFITPFQAGIKNIVASLGTALTVDQIKLIRRFTEKVIILYDSDKAGELATLRGLDLLVEEGLEVKIVRLPSGYDPDSFIRKEGKEKFLKLVNDSKTVFDYKLELLRSRHDIRRPERKADLALEMLSTIKKFKSIVVRSSYIKRLAEAINVSEEDLLSELKDFKEYSGKDSRIGNSSYVNFDIPAVEKTILKLVLEEGRLFDSLVKKIDADSFQDLRIKKIFETMFELFSQGKSIAANKLINYLEDETLVKIISEVGSSDVPKHLESQDLLDDCLVRLQRESQKSQLKLLQDRIKTAQLEDNESEMVNLMKDYNHLIRITKGCR